MPNANEKPKMVDHEAPEEPKRKAPKRRSASKAFADLKAIYHYGEEDGLPDLTKLERRKRNPRAMLIGLMLFFAVLAGAAWAGFFLFKPYARFEGGGVALGIDGPKEVKAGETVRYEFTYKNTERAALAALELRLVLPQEFHVLESIPAPTSDPSTWLLGNVPRRGDGKISLRGFFLGSETGRSSFQAVATYRPANFNADFQAITTLPVIITSSVLDAKVEGPTEAAPGEELEYTYTIKHTGSDALEGLEFHLEAPAAFLFASSEPAPTDARTLRWTIPPLEPNAETVIKLKGSFAVTAQGKTELPFAIGQIKEDLWFPHRRDIFTTDVLASDVSLDLVVNGATDRLTGEFGETLHATMSYKNIGERTIGDLTLSLRITASPGGLIDWDRATMSVDGRVRSGIITWTKKELPALARVRPGEEGAIDVNLLIVDDPPSRDGTDELLFSGMALIATLDDRLVARQVETPIIVASLNSDLSFTTGASRRDGALPLEVGETTMVRISWDIADVRHDLENLRIRTTLPNYMRWVSNTITNTGTVNWDEGSRTVTLQVPKLKADEALQSAFDLEITPSQAQSGSFVELTGETTASARDTKTGAAISHTRDPLTSESLTDESGVSRGIVIE